MTSPLLQLPWEDCLLQPVRDAQVEAYVRRETGTALPAWLRYFLPCPWLAKSLVQIAPDNGMLVALDFATADLIALVVSQEHSCRYCYAATRAMLRLLGMSEERMQRLEQALAVPELAPREAAAVRYARRVARANPLATPADAAPLREAGFSREEIREIAYVVASVACMNRVSTITAMPPQTFEQLPDRWSMRLLSPLLAPLLRRWRRRGKAVTSTAPGREPGASFAALIRAFEGSPVAGGLASTLDELWASPLLSRRAKGLMFAVIGRGLGCSSATAEATGILDLAGLDAAEVARLLSHLDAPGLDPVEAALLSFARESIWYEPVQIQRSARRLQAQLSTPAFVEAVGVVSLANAICRLQAALVGEA